MNVNRTGLINQLSEETASSKKETARFVNAFTRIISRVLKQGGKVQMSGFGTFAVSRRPSRKGINPATKERIDLPESKTPKFKAGKNFKESIQSIR